MRHSCVHCGHVSETFVEHHVCSSCGKPQPEGAGETYFSAFGLRPGFNLDRKDLETRFYKLSRVLHPDRYSTSDVESQKRSLERMSWINQAYRTLKEPELLRDYVLELEGAKTSTSGTAPAKAQIPAELAEGWFDVQDALMEDPETAREKLKIFETELQALKESGKVAILALEAKIDQAYEAHASGGPSPKELLESLAQKVQSQSYLNSMERDVERIRARFR